jgi:hypothetical protein
LSLARYELKFKLKAGQVHKVHQILSTLCIADQSHPHYPVLSRYFDDPELSDWRTKIEGEFFHKKIRLRTYAETFSPAQPIFLEAKVKSDHRTSKVRSEIQAQDYLGLPKHCHEELLQREIDRRVLRPICDVSYQRYAYVFEHGDQDKVRLTVDTNLQFCSATAKGQALPILPNGQAILEIKSEQQTLPVPLSHFLFRLNLRRQTFSKYVAAVDHIKQLELEGLWIPF